MSDKENYFRPGTPREVINDTLYTDYGTMHTSDYDALEQDLKAIELKEGEK